MFSDDDVSFGFRVYDSNQIPIAEVTGKYSLEGHRPAYDKAAKRWLSDYEFAVGIRHRRVLSEAER